MKKNDFLFIIIAAIILLPFIPLPFLSIIQKGFIYNPQFWVITSFIKFALLATMGEVIGLRIKTGEYNNPGFGILPRAIVWGFLGITIKLAFDIFSIGIPGFLEKSCSITGVADAMKTKDIFDAIANGMGTTRFLAALCISTAMNLIYAPIMMTFHKITDTHIVDNGGTLSGFFRKIKMGEILSKINWNVQWNFVFKKTIPFFWIPAHTITFMLPVEYRVAFAAVLGIALGIILSFAAIKGKSK
ncbi:MAG: Mpv17/PMP22 family protein [Bacteroidales bacterium]